jgi:hypothetical protein
MVEQPWSIEQAKATRQSFYQEVGLYAIGYILWSSYLAYLIGHGSNGFNGFERIFYFWYTDFDRFK